MAASAVAPRFLRTARFALDSVLSAVERVGGGSHPERFTARLPASPLTPAAMRVERSRAEGAAQTAVTLWFGEGPALPAPGAGRGVARGALQLGVGILGAAALAALTTLAAQRELRGTSVTTPRRITATVDAQATPRD